MRQPLQASIFFSARRTSRRGEVHSASGFFPNIPPSGTFDVSLTTADQPQMFYRLAQVVYPGPVYTPDSMAGSQMIMNFPNGEVLELNFDQNGTGTSRHRPNGTSDYTTGQIASYIWTPDAYKGSFLRVASTNIGTNAFLPVFTSSGGGTVRVNKESINHPIHLGSHLGRCTDDGNGGERLDRHQNVDE
jgi:hypothetical protein